MKKQSLILFLFCFSFQLIAQDAVIIPFFKSEDSGNKRRVIEDDPCFRSIETMIKEVAFREYDYSFVDYIPLIDKIGRTRLRNITEETDFIKLIHQEAGTQIYVIADIIRWSGRNSRTKKQVHALRINLTAFQGSTARNVAAVNINSGDKYYDDCQKLMQQAYFSKDETGSRKLEVFLSQLVSNPQKTLSINFTVKKGAEATYDTKLSNGKRLKRAITTWIKSNSLEQSARPTSEGSNSIFYREILMPEKGAAYTAYDYKNDLFDFLDTLSFDESEGLELSFLDDISGNTITFTLE